MDPPTKGTFDEMQALVGPVGSFKQYGRFLVKRSTKKKSSDLRFVPTNLMVEVVHAKTIGSDDYGGAGANRSSSGIVALPGNLELCSRVRHQYNAACPT